MMATNKKYGWVRVDWEDLIELTDKVIVYSYKAECERLENTSAVKIELPKE